VNQAANYLVGGLTPGPLGNDHPNIAPYGPVPCADRPLVIGAGNDGQFAALCRAIGRGDVAADARFASNADRVAHRAALGAVLGEVFATRDAHEWQALLEDAGVPCAPVNALDEVFTDPHVRAVSLVSEVHHPAGPVAQVGSPLRVDGERPAVRRAPPTLGADTDAVLRALGLSDSAIAALRAAGVC
jgi:crotonobetainyl-CoA:carnitine CoA-transferase CaiB-like acyl-CoA transferase